MGMRLRMRARDLRSIGADKWKVIATCAGLILHADYMILDTKNKRNHARDRSLMTPSSRASGLYYTVSFNFEIHYTILYYTVLYYTSLYHIISYYTVLYCTVLHYTLLYYILPCYNFLYCIIFDIAFFTGTTPF